MHILRNFWECEGMFNNPLTKENIVEQQALKSQLPLCPLKVVLPP